jgi:predicted nucleotidyltransferase
VHELPAAVRKALAEYRRLLAGEFGQRLADIRLFGSFARGDAEEDSDVHVTVIIRGLTEAERTVAVDLAMQAWRRHLDSPPLSPLVWSEQEFEDRSREQRRIARDVLEEGIAL